MKYRALGKTGVRVSEIGLGCSNLGGGVFGMDRRESLRLLDRAFDLGVNFFDTADGYGFGRSEEMIGAAFQSRRDRVVIATKGGALPSSLGRFAKSFLPILRPVNTILKPMRRSLKQASRRRQEFSPPHLAGAVDRSLTRLRTDYIDLYQLHSPAIEMEGRAEVFELLQRLVNQGKIRFYGVSSRSIEDAFIWLDCPGLSSLQVPFNLLEHRGGPELFSKAAKRGVAIIARVPFARGLLTPKGTVQTGRELWDKLDEFETAGIKRLGFLVQDGRRSLPAASLQFILGHPEVSTVIPGTRTVEHLEENVRALDSPPLTEEDFQRIRLF